MRTHADTSSDLHNMFGFNQNQITLQDAFNFAPFSFQNLKENNIRHA
jgi:hypothetical protein